MCCGHQPWPQWPYGPVCRGCWLDPVANLVALPVLTQSIFGSRVRGWSRNSQLVLLTNINKLRIKDETRHESDSRVSSEEREVPGGPVTSLFFVRVSRDVGGE